jgi:endonuclease III
MDPELKTLFQTLIEGQIRTDKSVNELATAVTKYVDTADARMKRIEENLDGLIRTIAAEHSNGHSQN